MKLELAALGLAAALGGGALYASRVSDAGHIRADTLPPKIYKVPAFEYHIVSEAEMKRVYQANGGIVGGGKVDGFQGRKDDGTIVVFTTRPKFVNDDPTCTLGHEVQHIIWRDYHK